MADLTASTYPVRVAAGPLDAAIDVPGSKSIANRALVCAALAAGTTTLRNVPGGDDTVAMLECIEQLGAGAARSDDDPTCVTVHGTAGALRPGPITLDAQLAGTTSRFVTALCALGHGTYVVDGRPPLRARPMGPLHTALAELGAGVNPAEGFGHLPVTIGGIRPSADATGRQRTIRMRGDISSQFITAVMLIAPYLPGGVRIELTTPLVSRPYVAITAAVMAAFGVGGVVIGEDHVDVPTGRYA
ncbi:MAG TPA: 3-phosphoshikimate 1-carboxyvinyltransferase, partial [Ilumatobacteraceae bacterium]